MINPSIFSYIKEEESNFETQEIQIGDNWWWNFRNHVQLIFHLKNGVFYSGMNNWVRAFKNIMEPLLNLSYWTEDLEVKDVVFFVESKLGRSLSFLVKKYHDEVYTKKYDLDKFFDDITESDLDYGGVVVQKGVEAVPEVLPLNKVAFCDQTNFVGGPIAFKHNFSPSGLRKMSRVGWGEESNGATISINDLIVLAENTQDAPGTTGVNNNRTTGKTIEVYIVRGGLPSHYLNDDNDMESIVDQVQIVAFYTKKDGKKEGVILYRKKEAESALKFFTSKEIPGRALGRGVGESLLHSQIWTNFLTIHKMGMLESAAKIPLYTDDSSYTNKNKIQDMENLEITTIEENKRIYQVPTAAPTNIQLFQNSVDEWFGHSQLAASAQDPVLGKEAPSGTTFRGQERTVAQGRGIHDRRRGQRAKFIEEIYRDWIIPDMVHEILEGMEFLGTLTSDEFQWVAEAMAENAVNRKMIDAILEGKVPTEEDRTTYKSLFKEELAKKGEKHLFSIIKDEFDGVEVKMGINIAGKQKDLVAMSDKILSIFQFVFSNPQGFQQAMQIPALAKSFQDILEFSGMNQVDFMSLTQPAPVPAISQQQMPQQAQQPQEALTA